MTPTVLFRVDAGPLIGAGHVMRCLTLAKALGEAGWEVGFVTRDLPEVLARAMRAQGHSLFPLPPGSGQVDIDGPPHANWLAARTEEDLEATMHAVVGSRFARSDFLVVDHYGIDARWHRNARAIAARLLVIDDLADRVLDADILVDQGLGSASRYDQLVPEETRRLVGPSYAMLRPEFAMLRPDAERRRVASGQVRTILVSTGFLDPGSALGMCLDALEGIEVRINVAVSSNAPTIEDLRSRAASDARIQLVEDTDCMAALMLEADLSVGAGGATSWERCCLGLPTVALALADNQREALLKLSELGAISAPSLNANSIHAALQHLLRDGRARDHMAHSGMALIDGRGVDRVVEAVLEDRH